MLSRKHWIVIVTLIVLAIIAYDLTPRKTQNDSNAETSQSILDKTSWKLYRPQNGRFEVLMPALPQHVSESHPNGSEFTKYDVYLAQDHLGNIFLVSVTQYPNSFIANKDEDVLESVMNGAVGANSKNTLKHSKRSTFLNLPSLDFTIQSTDSAIRTKAILDGNILYVLTVMDRDPNRIENEFNTFAGSFAIKNPHQPAPGNRTHSERTQVSLL